MRCPSCRMNQPMEVIKRKDEDGEPITIELDLSKRSCNFCGFKLGEYMKFNSRKEMMRDNVTNDGSEQHFLFRHHVKSRRISKYKDEGLRRKSRTVQKFLSENQGNAYSYRELAWMLGDEVGNYKGLTKILDLLKKSGLLHIREVKSEYYYALR